MNFIANTVAKVFGTKSDKDIKGLLPYVDQIHKEYEKLQGISDQELRDKTGELKKTIDGGLSKIDQELAQLHQRIADEPDLDLNAKEEIFNQIDSLEDDRNGQLEIILMDILPLAFAVIKETAIR